MGYGVHAHIYLTAYALCVIIDASHTHIEAQMEAVRETTGGLFPAHTYLLDGNNLVAYIKKGETEPYYFKQPIKGFSKSGRKFDRVTSTAFTMQVEPEVALKAIQGSKGSVYYVNEAEGTCTCPGYTFRGSCKHVKELL